MRRVLVIVCTLGVTAAVCLGGCSYRTMLEKMAPNEEVEFARARLDELRAGRLDELQAHLDGGSSNPGTRAELERMMRYMRDRLARPSALQRDPAEVRIDPLA